jgi:hypothetical protein
MSIGESQAGRLYRAESADPTAQSADAADQVLVLDVVFPELAEGFAVFE